VANVVAWIIADDPDELLKRFVEALNARGFEVLEADIKSKPVEPHRTNARGVEYDLATGTLTIETHDPGWADVTLALMQTEEYVLGIMASDVGGRVEDGFPGLQRIVVRRWGGNPINP
jgi:hypothetical protein